MIALREPPTVGELVGLAVVGLAVVGESVGFGVCAQKIRLGHVNVLEGLAPIDLIQTLSSTFVAVVLPHLAGLVVVA